MKDNLCGIGAFSKRAGVSVRTLQYYDRIGLLKPIAYSESGRRLYSESDMVRLQQIITLKFIGLSLDAIKKLLAAHELADMGQLLGQQKEALQEKMRQLQRVISTIEAADATLAASGSFNLEQFINIIREIHMSAQTNWLDQFLTTAQQQAASDSMIGGTIAEQKQIGEAWRALFQDIQAYLAGIPDAAQEQALITRWHMLMTPYSREDPQLIDNIEAAYAHIMQLVQDNNFPLEVQTWLKYMQEAALFARRAG